MSQLTTSQLLRAVYTKLRFCGTLHHRPAELEGALLIMSSACVIFKRSQLRQARCSTWRHRACQQLSWTTDPALQASHLRLSPIPSAPSSHLVFLCLIFFLELIFLLCLIHYLQGYFGCSSLLLSFCRLISQALLRLAALATPGFLPSLTFCSLPS